MRAVPYVRVFLGLILISGLIFGLDSIRLLSLPKTALYDLTTPIQYGLYNLGQNVAKEFSFVGAVRHSSQENKALQEQIAQLLSENAQLRTKLAEVGAQLDQQVTLDPKTHDMLAARPIGVDRYLKIDKGSADGVKINQPVIFKDNLIGQVIELSEKGANVRFLSDPSSKVAAFSLNKDGKAKGILTGQFGEDMLLDKILHEEKIEEGDLVYSEGTEGYLPRGLILGRVTEVKPNTNEVFKQAIVKPIFDTRDLEVVYVLQD